MVAHTTRRRRAEGLVAAVAAAATTHVTPTAAYPEPPAEIPVALLERECDLMEID